jgi:hypothetical protein
MKESEEGENRDKRILMVKLIIQRGEKETQ